MFDQHKLSSEETWNILSFFLKLLNFDRYFAKFSDFSRKVTMLNFFKICPYLIFLHSYSVNNFISKLFIGCRIFFLILYFFLNDSMTRDYDSMMRNYDNINTNNHDKFCNKTTELQDRPIERILYNHN